MRLKNFRYCMLAGAIALGCVAAFYFIRYVGLSSSLSQSSVSLSLQDSVRALWLTVACQSLLIGMVYTLVAFRPLAVSREIIVLLGLLQLAKAVLLFVFAGSTVIALLLLGASLCVLAGALLWQRDLPAAAALGQEQPAPRQLP